jgi:hypothetical protein
MLIKELEIEKDVFDRISYAMDIFCEYDEDMKEKYDIESDDILYSFDINFDNGYKAEIYVNSGNTNCWMDYILLDEKNKEIECMLGESSIYDGDIIEFAYNPGYAIKIKKVN